MKPVIYTILLFFGSSLLLNAQKTAFDSLEAFGKSRGEADLKQVVGVTGSLGQDQPNQWMILTKDPNVKNLMHEYAMNKGKVIGERHFSRNPEQKLPLTALPLNLLNVDSSKAFQIANQTATKSNIGFDSISYLLRIHNTNKSPIWTLTLIDQKSNTVGIIHISASSGKLINKTWFRPGTNEYTQLNERTATDEIKDIWNRGVDSVSKGFNKLDKKIGEKLNRN